MMLLLPLRKQSRSLLSLVCLLAVLGLGSGCKTLSLTDPVAGSGYQPVNVYRAFNKLPVHLRRVAVLPTTCDPAQSDLIAGLDVLTTIIGEELGKTKKLEVVTVTSEQLRAWTGRPTIQAESPLPAQLLKKLRDELDCDAVLFSRLTQYRAYPPLAVGFGFKLAETDKAELIWVVDEIFDASDPSVVNSARRYQLAREQLPSSLADSRSILNSPSGFGRYAANSVFETLPKR